MEWERARVRPGVQLTLRFVPRPAVHSLPRRPTRQKECKDLSWSRFSQLRRFLCHSQELKLDREAIYTAIVLPVKASPV